MGRNTHGASGYREHTRHEPFCYLHFNLNSQLTSVASYIYRCKSQEQRSSSYLVNILCLSREVFNTTFEITKKATYSQQRVRDLSFSTVHPPSIEPELRCIKWKQVSIRRPLTDFKNLNKFKLIYRTTWRNIAHMPRSYNG